MLELFHTLHRPECTVHAVNETFRGSCRLISAVQLYSGDLGRLPHEFLPALQKRYSLEAGPGRQNQRQEQQLSAPEFSMNSSHLPYGPHYSNEVVLKPFLYS